MGRVTITAYGTGTRDEEGIRDFPNKPNAVATLEKGGVVGFCYKVAGTGEKVDVDLSVVAAPESEKPPAPEYFRSQVEPDKEYFRSSELPDGFFEAGQPYWAYFHATADGGDEVDSASCLVFPSSLGRVFSEQTFAPATDEAIAAFEARFDTKLRYDYRAFLKSRNGTDMVWWRDPRWRTGPFQTDEQGLYKPSPFYEELGKLEPKIRERLGAHGEGVTYFFGIGNRHPYMDIAQPGDEFGFYRKELMRHAYLVAEDGGGNNYVQVTQGKHAGAVFGCDHELYYGGLSPMVDFEGLDEKERADLPWTDFKDATTDAFIDKASEYGFIYKIDESFEAYYQREVAVARALTEALAPGYLSK